MKIFTQYALWDMILLTGEKIPSEHVLCQEYEMSRITVHQELSELEKEGYLIRKQGKGTFVSIPKIEQNLMSFYSFSEELKRGLYLIQKY